MLVLLFVVYIRQLKSNIKNVKHSRICNFCDHTLVGVFNYYVDATSIYWIFDILDMCIVIRIFLLFQIYVDDKTIWFVAVTPKFRVYPQNPTEAYEGYPIMIHCIADGDPKPTIKWDRNSNFSGFDRNRWLETKNVMFRSVAAMLFNGQVVYNWIIFTLNCFRTDYHHYTYVMNLHQYLWNFGCLVLIKKICRFWQQFRGFRSSGLWYCVMGGDAITIEDESSMVIQNIRSH